MSESQIRTLSGVFAAACSASWVCSGPLFVQLIRVEIGGLRNEMIARFEHLDRDVQAIAAKLFPSD